MAEHTQAGSSVEQCPFVYNRVLMVSITVVINAIHSDCCTVKNMTALAFCQQWLSLRQLLDGRERSGHWFAH